MENYQELLEMFNLSWLSAEEESPSFSF